MQPAQPAAGVEWSAAVPAGMLWQVLAIQAQLVTSAVVANRNVGLSLALGGVNVGRIGSQASQPASQTGIYSWLGGHGAITLNNLASGATAPFPPIPLAAGMTIASVTLAIDAGDQWSGVALYVAELSEHGLLAQSEWLERRRR